MLVGIWVHQNIVFLFQEQDIFYLSPPFKYHLAKPSNVFLISSVNFKCPGESYLQIGFSIGTCEVTRHQSGSILHTNLNLVQSVMCIDSSFCSHHWTWSSVLLIGGLWSVHLELAISRGMVGMPGPEPSVAEQVPWRPNITNHGRVLRPKHRASTLESKYLIHKQTSTITWTHTPHKLFTQSPWRPSKPLDCNKQTPS